MKTLKVHFVINGIATCEDDEDATEICAAVGTRFHEWVTDYLDFDEVDHWVSDIEIETSVRPEEEETPKALQAAIQTLKTAYPELRAVRNVEDSTTELERAQHLLWMCDEVRAYLSLDQPEKAVRWLGFVQRSIDAMQADVSV